MQFDLSTEMIFKSTVLVTGGSGFIGSHSILQLLAAGHKVRTTVRSLKREPDVRAMLKESGTEPGDRLSFIAADLENDTGWPLPAATMCCTWRRLFPILFPSTKTN